MAANDSITIRRIFSELDYPDPRIQKKTIWPRHLNNKRTRDHLTGKTLSSAVLKIELDRLQVIWSQTQATRDRKAVFDFIAAAFAVVVRYADIGKGKRLLRRLQRLDPLSARMRDSYAAVLHIGTGHSFDSRTRSRWSRVLRYAESKKISIPQLEGFIGRCGGINECAARARASEI